MKLTDLTIHDLFQGPLTFLVGAGCSIDAPSCLPAGLKMINAIIDFSCVETEKKKILALPHLRFEQLVEIFQKYIDPELKVIDFYGQCDKPNLLHFFLAEMMKKGHFLMTTNFDFLIEYALLQSGVPKESVRPIITRSDFRTNQAPSFLTKQNIYGVYKVHGSAKNIISGADTKKSLIITIHALGTNKEGQNIFQVEEFKRTIFLNISRKRTLIIMGYSGSDDFDIVPTLKVLKDLKSVVWLKYDSSAGEREKIYEVELDDTEKDSVWQDSGKQKLTKVEQILYEIKKIAKIQHIYQVNVNTSNLVQKLSEQTPPLSESAFDADPFVWLKNQLPEPDEFAKILIPLEIYSRLTMLEDYSRLSNRLLSLARQKRVKEKEVEALSHLAVYQFSLGKQEEALRLYEEALQVIKSAEKITQFNSLHAIILSDIAVLKDQLFIHSKTEAIRMCQKALDLLEEIKEDGKDKNDEKQRYKSMILQKMGGLKGFEGNITEAIEFFQQAIKIDEKRGDLRGKSSLITNIGNIYASSGDIEKAMKMYHESLQIDDKLGDLSGKAVTLNAIGELNHALGSSLKAMGKANQASEKFSEALDNFREAASIHEDLGMFHAKVDNLRSIAITYMEQFLFKMALKKVEQALKITENLDELGDQAQLYQLMGVIYVNMRKKAIALQSFKKGIKLLNKMGKNAKNSPFYRTLTSNISDVKRM